MPIIENNGKLVIVRMKRDHDMPKRICVRRRNDDGTDDEIWFEPESVFAALAKLLGKARDNK